jgi:phage terminase large subunit-like protein
MTLTLPTTRDIDAEFCRRDFYRFVREAWPYVMPGVEFVDGWHIKAICKYLQALEGNTLGRLIEKIFHIRRKLIINIPPGHMKSLLVSVFFPAWIWTRDQRKRFICVTHSETFATRDSLLCRNLISSDWYKSLFHVELAGGDQLKTRYSNTSGGFRHAYGLAGMTGDHGEYLLWDDLLNKEDRYSEAAIKQINDLYDNVLPLCIDPRDGKEVGIMQRLSRNDLTNHIQQIDDNAEFLILPEEYEGEVFVSSIGFKDPRKKKGELLWKEMFGSEWLAKIKKQMSALDVAGQLQQRPSPIEGAIWKREWFAHNRIQNTSIIARLISGDTAESIRNNAAYSAIGVWEITESYHIFLRYVRRGRWEFNDLTWHIEDIAQMYYKFHGNHRDNAFLIAIESKSSGTSAMQSLKSSSAIINRIARELGKEPSQIICPINPTVDKDARMFLVQNPMQKGVVHLPIPDASNSEWLPTYEDEIFEAPNSAYRDQADMTSQAISFMQNYLEVALMSQR